MGRKTLPEDQKTKPLNMRLQPDERAGLEKKMEKSGLTLTEEARLAIKKHIGKK